MILQHGWMSRIEDNKVAFGCFFSDSAWSMECNDYQGFVWNGVVGVCPPGLYVEGAHELVTTPPPHTHTNTTISLCPYQEFVWNGVEGLCPAGLYMEGAHECDPPPSQFAPFKGSSGKE